MWLHKIFWNICTGFTEYLTFYKGKGGGGGGSQQSTSYTTNLPEYAKPFYEELLKQSGKQVYETDASGVVTGVKPYQSYTGDRLADFTTDQEQIRKDVLAMTQPAGFQTAAGTLGTVGSQAGTASQTGLNQAFGYTPGTVTPSTVTTDKFDTVAAQQYMDPYTRSVLDVQKDEAKRQAGIQQQQQAMASIGRGTFGGGREALMQSEADRNTQQLLAKIEAEGQTEAFKRAQEAFQQDQARKLQADIQNQATGLQAAELGQQAEQFQAGLGKDIGLAGLATGLETGKATGALSATEQMAELERKKAQAATAAEVQALEQEQLNLAYQQYMEEQDYERRLLEYQSNILRGTQGALGTTQVAYAPAPSLASQIGGLGLAGLGLYNILGNKG